MIVRVIVVLNRTVLDGDSADVSTTCARGSHLPSHRELYHVS